MKWNLSYPHYDRNVLLYFSLVQKQNQSITNQWGVCVARVHSVITARCEESGRLATTEYIYTALGVPRSFLPTLLPAAPSFLIAHRIFFHIFGGFSFLLFVTCVLQLYSAYF